VRRWRAWACWALVRVVLPELPGDPKHRVTEPTSEEITAHLRACGLPGEAELWRTEMKNAGWRGGVTFP